MRKKQRMDFTGERVIEGASPDRVLSDHISRYNFARNHAKEKNTLDIACGTGYGAKILSDGGSNSVIGVDISPESINYAMDEYGEDGILFEEGDISNINFRDNHFDLITCFETIEHIHNQEAALRELYRVLTGGGTLIISSPNRKLTSPYKSVHDAPDNPFHTKEYSTTEFISAVSKYFVVRGAYAQRGINKMLTLPFIEQTARRALPMLYHPGSGSPHISSISSHKEYRYITLVCGKQ